MDIFLYAGILVNQILCFYLIIKTIYSSSNITNSRLIEISEEIKELKGD